MENKPRMFDNFMTLFQRRISSPCSPSSSDSPNSIPFLSPIANSVVARCSNCFDVENGESGNKPITYARHLLEFCCYRAFNVLTARADYLSDKEFRRLTYDMMLAWEAPGVDGETLYKESASPSRMQSEDDDGWSLFYSSSTATAVQVIHMVDNEKTVGPEAFARIAPVQNLFDALTNTSGNRLHFLIYEKYLQSLGRVIKSAKNVSSVLSNLEIVDGEIIVDVDGTVPTQPILQHIGISAWPGEKMGRRRRGGGSTQRKWQSIEQGMERKILVRSLNNIEDKVQYQNEDGNMVEEIFRREEFHIVDLKLDKIYHNCLPSLRRAAEVGEMVALGQSIFIFGGQNEISSPLPDSQLNYYVGASRLHFGVGVGVGETWGSAPINDPNEYNYTCLNGDVYCIGNVLAPKVLHVDTTNGVPHGPWKSLGPLPSKLVDCSPSMPVIPDPTNNRILIHLNDGQLSSSSLYAFYPPTHGTCAGTWKCLDSNVSDWDRVQDAALLDGVLYLHAHKLRNLVHAYEVATAKWFDVQWSTRVIEKDFSVDDCTFRFDSLFCLDDTNKILCLAVYSPVVPIVPGGDRCDRSLPTNTTLLFFKFKAERCGSTITLTPLYTRSYEILSTYQVLDFLPL
ncbi:uncharacterized protein LOC110714988 isoform X3 [Chenopodium quinoa]|uniref:uncharacterized protein LOC110714988 isoform X3 n=1 Tax=Chenopodium quinoa TaxID=63459 RepID=UPI000B77DFFE|nr:uncharacterized protein LOC110714988 isoform X3 [Chenopodium quinoa]